MNDIANIAITFKDESTCMDQYDLIKDLTSKDFKLTLVNVKYNAEIGKLIAELVESGDLISSFSFCNLKKGLEVVVEGITYKAGFISSINPRFIKIGEGSFVGLGTFELLENLKFVKDIKNF
jgi:hypothetical protein